MNEEIRQKIQTLLLATLEKMDISGSVDIIEYFDAVHFTIKSRDAALLIGSQGEHLRALNHIMHRMAEKISSEDSARPQFSVDVNDYQKQRIDALNELARMSAQRVRYFKKDVEMDPMNAYERRIIHSALAEYPDIATESTGEGEVRRVVIKPL